MGRLDVEDVDVNWEIHRRELAERRHIVESCEIDIYSSSINPRWGYPHKLMSFWEARESVADSAEELIIDSGYRRYGDLDQILLECEKVEADWFIPPDVTPHFDIYEQVRPEDRAKEAWEYGKEADAVDAKMLLPIHRPVEDHLDELESFQPEGESGTVNLLERFDGVAVGLKGVPVNDRIRILAKINRKTGPMTHVHALSPGTEMEMIAYLRENPHMVDSLDVSTPESAPANNKIPDHNWYQHVVPLPTGDDISTLRATRSTGIVLALNFMLSDLCDDDMFSEIRTTETAVLSGQIDWRTFVEEVIE